MIWFSSDFHFSHSNICYGISKWKDKETDTRRFDTLHEMNKALIESINKCVQQDDTLYFLGDWSFGGIENIWKLRKRIICRNIHFILGNHEQHIKKNKLIEIPKSETSLLDGLGVSINWEIQFGEYILIEPQLLFTSIQDYLELEIDNYIFVLSHYPLEEWFEMDRKGAIMLHGHCHHKIDNCETNTKYKRMDVGIDWKEFRPYSLEEIVKQMSKREMKKHLIH